MNKGKNNPPKSEKGNYDYGRCEEIIPLPKMPRFLKNIA
jgi:hypothetical protein